MEVFAKPQTTLALQANASACFQAGEKA